MAFNQAVTRQTMIFPLCVPKRTSSDQLLPLKFLHFLILFIFIYIFAKHYKYYKSQLFTRYFVINFYIFKTDVKGKSKKEKKDVECNS